MRRNFHEVREPLVMIIPMIDIMLFLLVFFMLSTMYMVNTSTVQVNLPQAATAQQDTRPHIISITVTEDGKILFDRDDEPTRELSARVKTQLETDPDTVFVVRGDKKRTINTLSPCSMFSRKRGHAMCPSQRRREGSECTTGHIGGSPLFSHSSSISSYGSCSCSSSR